MQTKPKPLYSLTKRVIDVFISASALIVLSPVMAVTAILVRGRLGSPVIFRHPRPGLHEKTFYCLKFRSMTNERDSNGQLLKEELRLTEFGKLLRRTSLDELPQLWSVLVGDMSLVGPRPLEVRDLPRYSREQSRRHSVPPGITGWAQVNGRNEIEWSRKLALDVWYVENLSFGLDLKILAKTVGVAFSGAGISADDHATMPRFDEVMAKRQGAEDV